jgi:hypothetical protein
VNTVEFSLARSGGFTGVVTPVAAGLPTGVVASFSPATFGVGVTAVTMTLTATSAPLIANDAYTVTFSGSGVSDVVYSGTVSVIATPTYGPGPNAPAWIGKTVYTDERFAVPIPEGGSANAAGFRLVNGFGNDAPDGNRISYPTVSTPLGSKPVMRMAFRGQTESITALNQTSTSYPFNPFIYWNASVFITGTWSGTLTFETSPDGTTWTATSLTAIPAPPILPAQRRR